MFQKALSGEEKSDLGTTTTKLGEDKEEPGVSCLLSPHLDSEPALAAADHIPLASREKAAAWSGQHSTETLQATRAVWLGGGGGGKSHGSAPP